MEVYNNELGNIKKYWDYRKRLKDGFIFLSDNDEYGSNIPVDRVVKNIKVIDGEIIVNDKIDTLVWDDCNGALPYYIILLATEYKILKTYPDYNINNIDAKSTLNELKNAIKALKRLDRYADGIENGVFRRSDILYIEKRSSDEELGDWAPVFNHFDKVNGNNKVNLRFSEMDKNKARYNSIDNIIKFIEAESMVRSLLSDEGDDAVEVSVLLYESVKKMIGSAYHPDKPLKLFNRNKFAKHKGFMQRTWYLNDPDSPTSILPESNGGAGDLYTFATSYGLSKSASNFNLEYKSTDLSGLFFKILMKIKTKKFKKIKNSFWMIRSLVTTNNISKNPYEYLKNAENRYFKKLEQYPLMWSVLNNYKVSDEDRNEIYKLLSLAPENGIRNLLYTDENKKIHYIYDVYEWSCPNRFVWSGLNGDDGTNKDGWKRHGYYNGIDYMLLHNLYWLTK